jgi:PEP-CTERM motif
LENIVAKHSHLHWFRSLVAATCFVLGGAAQGTVFYNSDFDPIDFKGIAKFGIEDACLLTPGWHANAPGCLVTMVSAAVTITGTTPDPLTVTFAPPTVSGPFQIYGIFVGGGELLGVDSALMEYVSAAPFTSVPWWLEFVSGQMPPSVTSAFAPSAAGNVVNLYTGSCPTTDNRDERFTISSDCVPNLNSRTTATTVNFTRAAAVPEPATLALLLGALGGGFLVRRRRSVR